MHRLRDSRPMQRSLGMLLADPEAMALIRSRALMPPLDAEQLLTLPKGSLGQVFGALIQALGYSRISRHHRSTSTTSKPMPTM